MAAAAVHEHLARRGNRPPQCAVSNLPWSGSTTVNSPRAFVSSDRSSPPPDAITRASAIGRLSGSTMRPVTGPASAGAAETKRAEKRGRKRTFTGLLSACSRAALREKRKGRPGVRILARRSLRHPRLPRRVCAQWLRPPKLADAQPGGGRECTSRLQWRHRVGFAPTSHDRRACLADARVSSEGGQSRSRPAPRQLSSQNTTRNRGLGARGLGAGRPGASVSS